MFGNDINFNCIILYVWITITFIEDGAHCLAQESRNQLFLARQTVWFGRTKRNLSDFSAVGFGDRESNGDEKGEGRREKGE